MYEGTIAPPYLLCLAWEKELLSPSMAHSTVSANDTVRQLDHHRKLDNASNDKKQKIATRLLRESLYSQDFDGPISVRATRILGPISRCCVADVLPHMKLTSRVGIRRVLCNGMCTAQRFHNDEEEHTCRIGCPDRPGPLSLSPTTVNVVYCTINSLLGRGRRTCNHREATFFLISQVFFRCFQFGITVMGLIDAFCLCA